MSAALEIIDRAIDAATAEIERLTHSSAPSELVRFHWRCRLAELQNLRADIARAETQGQETCKDCGVFIGCNELCSVCASADVSIEELREYY